MKYSCLIYAEGALAALALLLSVGWGSAAQSDGHGPRHYIFFGRDRHRIHETPFLATASIAGAQLTYAWRELEPERDRYDLQPLRDDLDFLTRHGKRLFVQIQDLSFDDAIVNVPNYLLTDSTFGGGVARKYEFEGAGDAMATSDGWVARRWDPAVRARFKRLLQALGREFDGRIEGVNLTETAIDFGGSGKLHPPGFTYERYVEGVMALMTAARAAFPRSYVIEYANFMPGESLPADDHGYLRRVYAHADRIGVGVGGPDLLPYRQGQQNHSYPLIAARGPRTVAGVAVQWGNLADRNPATGQRVTVAELARFAREDLRLDFVFWGTQEPYFTNEVLPYLRTLAPEHDR
jgi:hypothetical protein